MKSLSGKWSEHDQAGRLHRAGHLRDALIQRAHERQDTIADLARQLDMSPGHLYRIKKDPGRLGHLTLDRLDSVASYVGWPRVQVFVAVGWLDQAEIDDILSMDGVMQSAIGRLRNGGIANGLVTPLSEASPDHLALMARLLVAAEAAYATIGFASATAAG